MIFLSWYSFAMGKKWFFIIFLCQMCVACHGMQICFICPRFSFIVNGMYDIFVNIHVLVLGPDVSLEVLKA